MKPVEAVATPAYTGVMTSCLTRLRARRTRRQDLLDPTRPGPVRVEDGVPIAHVGPPGFPGAPLPGEDEEGAP